MRLLTLIAFTVPFIMHAQSDPCPQHPSTLEAMRDCYRPLIIFSPAANDARLHQHLVEFTHHAMDLHERDILIVISAADHQQVATSQSQSLPATQLELEEDNQLRDRFKVSKESFVVLLVGKDGGEKLRSEKIVTVDSLNHKIDAMPMRKAEQTKQSQDQ